MVTMSAVTLLEGWLGYILPFLFSRWTKYTTTNPDIKTTATMSHYPPHQPSESDRTAFNKLPIEVPSLSLPTTTDTDTDPLSSTKQSYTTCQPTATLPPTASYAKQPTTPLTPTEAPSGARGSGRHTTWTPRRRQIRSCGAHTSGGPRCCDER